MEGPPKAIYDKRDVNVTDRIIEAPSGAGIQNTISNTSCIPKRIIPSEF